MARCALLCLVKDKLGAFMPKEKEEQDSGLVNSYLHMYGDKTESEVYDECEVQSSLCFENRKSSISEMNGVRS